MMNNQINPINLVELVINDEYVANALSILKEHNAMRISKIPAFGVTLMQCEIAAADTPALLSDCASYGMDAYIR